MKKKKPTKEEYEKVKSIVTQIAIEQLAKKAESLAKKVEELEIEKGINTPNAVEFKKQTNYIG